MTFETLARVAPEQLQEVVEVPPDTPVLKGDTGFRATRGEMLLHAATHAVYHRSQIRHGLTRLGVSIPEPDYIFVMTETGRA
ncbi:DinB family protein [Limnochorda pilosa]